MMNNRRLFLVICIALAVATVGYYVRNISVQAQGRGQSSHPGMQPDGTFVGADGTQYASQQAFVESGMRCGFKHSENDEDRSFNAAPNKGGKPGGGGGGGSLPPGSVTINVYIHVITNSSGQGAPTTK